jgi:membrane associated rhomboid family serine protease
LAFGLLYSQLFSEVGAIANTDETSDVGGVAYMAHIGGFLAGFLLTFLFSRCDGSPNVNAPIVLT